MRNKIGIVTAAASGMGRAGMSPLAWEAAVVLVSALGPPGFNRVISPRRKRYATRDGYACILPYSDRNWQDFFDFTGRTEFKDDPRFARLGVRVQNIDVLYTLMEEEAQKRSTAEWVAFCDQVSIPCMPVNALDDLFEDPHLSDVGFFSTAEHPSEGPYRAQRRPISFSSAPFEIRRHAPRLGEQTREVLAEAGVCEADIRALTGEADTPASMEQIS